MVHIGIVVPENAVPQAIADPQYLFSAVNQFLIAAGKKKLFTIQLVGTEKEICLFNGTFTIKTDLGIKQPKKFDLIIVPALFGNMEVAVASNEKLIPWLKTQYRKGAAIASLCVGAFLLAATGLLDGKKCSTHWGFQQEFKTMFPLVQVQYGAIITEENHLYSSGGANSYWNLLLLLVEKYTDRAMAIQAAKYFAIDINKNSQASYTIFNGQKNHADLSVQDAQVYIENNLQEKISVEHLARLTNTGRRSFERRFKQATGNTVLNYIHRVKIEAAKRSLESGQKNSNEVMLATGYNDAKAFRTIFKKITGLTPAAYKNKYHKMADT